MKARGWILFYIAFLLVLGVIGSVVDKIGYRVTHIFFLIFAVVLTSHIVMVIYKGTDAKLVKTTLVLAGLNLVFGLVISTFSIYSSSINTVRRVCMWLMIILLAIALIQRGIKRRRERNNLNGYKEVKIK